jgi:hypothetical protein
MKGLGRNKERKRGLCFEGGWIRGDLVRKKRQGWKSKRAKWRKGKRHRKKDRKSEREIEK